MLITFTADQKSWVVDVKRLTKISLLHDLIACTTSQSLHSNTDISIPVRYKQVFSNYVFFLTRIRRVSCYKLSYIIDCLRLADFLCDDDYFDWLIQVLFDKWTHYYPLLRRHVFAEQTISSDHHHVFAEQTISSGSHQDTEATQSRTVSGMSSYQTPNTADTTDCNSHLGIKRLERMILDRIVIKLPYQFLPQQYRADVNFIAKWVRSSMSTTIILNGLTWHINHPVDSDNAKSYGGDYHLSSYEAKTGSSRITYVYDSQSKDSDLSIRNLTINGGKHGCWLEYYSNGILKSKANYHDDRREGLQEWFNSQGQMTATNVYHS